MTKAGKLWTNRDVEKLEAMAGKHPNRAIAAALGRSPKAVQRKAIELDIRLRMPPRARAPLIEVDEAAARRRFEQCPGYMRRIIESVSFKTTVPVEAILSQSRRQDRMLARRIMIWTVARDTNFAMFRIGKLLGLDHTTILHAIRRQNDATGENVRGVGGVRPETKEAQVRFLAKRAASGRFQAEALT
ncbi:hypothetical protein ASE63_22325 [Bosea sp. Root381]|uniref:helix-turn-helix domain-containing protein n=1 Tax=Bosea sp. Root381 TaxID=1736524 RepID=UPI0006F220FC|nr:helix-turn-helix domain-containing protein [Bosea sp. Root381]KRE07438.1 hypothetical protein ASE63_22325 [Bosea sp. Root381]